MTATTPKPPYLVPTMDDIRAIPWNGLTAVSTFSGCGGSSLGYRLAGYRMLWASEFVPLARETYLANSADHTAVDGRDIRQVTAAELLDVCGLDVGELDLLDGSPPCASFSTSGSRHDGWGKVKTYSDRKQRTDDLFYEFARILEGVQPRVFVAENVSGLVTGTGKGYFKLILARLKEAGYQVTARLLDASRLGVPQGRRRLIFVGVRRDVGAAPVHPVPLPYTYSAREAFDTLTHPDDVEHDPETGQIISIRDYSIYPLWCELRPGESHEQRINLGRCHPDRPSFTITATMKPADASPCHWSQPRKFSLAELRRLCSFPDDFALIGSYPKRAERLGRAVPPLMMQAVAERIRDDILIPAHRSTAEDTSRVA